MNTKGQGNTGELAIAFEFSKYGIPVLFPFGDNEPYDLVVELSGFKKVQVKTTSEKDGKIKVPVRKRIGSNNIGSQSYKIDGIDFLGIYCISNGKTYLVPFSEITCDYDVVLRIDLPKNNQTKGVNWAKDFEFEIQIKKLLKKI